MQMHLYCNKQLETTVHQFCEKPLHITFNSINQCTLTANFCCEYSMT